MTEHGSAILVNLLFEYQEILFQMCRPQSYYKY